MKKINVVCPKCGKFKRLEITNDIFDYEEGSLLKFPIRTGMVCDHEFIAILDFHFSVRDYEIPLNQTEYDHYFNRKKESNKFYG